MKKGLIKFNSANCKDALENKVLLAKFKLGDISHNDAWASGLEWHHAAGDFLMFFVEHGKAEDIENQYRLRRLENIAAKNKSARAELAAARPWLKSKAAAWRYVESLPDEGSADCRLDFRYGKFSAFLSDFGHTHSKFFMNLEDKNAFLARIGKIR